MQKEQLILLAEKYLNKTATDAEQQLLHQWYDRWEDNEEEVLVSNGQTADLIRERILARLKEEINKESAATVAPVHRVHFLKTSWFRYAAAVVLIAGAATAVGVFINHNRSANLPEAWGSNGKDIAPGSSKAVLTLADGSTMVLDHAQNGDLVQQGNAKVVKLATGQLAYKMSSLSLSKEVLYNTISTPRGGQYQIVLPDGTRVWLNAASSIKFPTAFTGSNRSVEINGEAYLEVSKNSKQPFFVHTNRTTVEVLGTSFNVNAYADEESDKTTLIDGSVRVVSSKQSIATGRSITLRPAQQAIVSASDANKNIDVQTADVDKVMAWKNGLFNFSNADLPTAMRQLERWYDIQVKYEGEIPKFSFRGRLDRNVNLSEVLDILDKMGVKFKVEGRTLIVSGSDR